MEILNALTESWYIMEDYQVLYYFKKVDTLPEDFLESKHGRQAINNACEKGWIEKCHSVGSDLVKYRITANGQNIIATHDISFDTPQKLVNQSHTSYRNNVQSQSPKTPSTAHDYFALSESQQKEAETNTKGKLILAISLLLIIIACFAFGGGMVAGVIGMIGVFGFIVGFFMTFTNRNKGTIIYQKEQALKQANLNIQMAQLGMNPAKENAKVEQAKAAKKAATKEIVKGAVIGGIVAGEAGAVVGAMVAKNKLDSENSEKAKN